MPGPCRTCPRGADSLRLKKGGPAEVETSLFMPDMFLLSKDQQLSIRVRVASGLQVYWLFQQWTCEESGCRASASFPNAIRIGVGVFTAECRN